MRRAYCWLQPVLQAAYAVSSINKLNDISPGRDIRARPCLSAALVLMLETLDA